MNQHIRYAQNRSITIQKTVIPALLAFATLLFLQAVKQAGYWLLEELQEVSTGKWLTEGRKADSGC